MQIHTFLLQDLQNLQLDHVIGGNLVIFHRLRMAEIITLKKLEALAPAALQGRRAGASDRSLSPAEAEAAAEAEALAEAKAGQPKAAPVRKGAARKSASSAKTAPAGKRTSRVASVSKVKPAKKADRD